MDEAKQDGSEVHETTETVEETVQTPEEETVTLTKSEADELRRKAEVSSQNFERAKKAEAEAKAAKSAQEPKVETSDLSSKDVIFLAKADVHEDDVDEVLEWAKFKKISVSEAFKQLKPSLDIKAEQRQTAQAANVSNTRRPSAKVTDEALLAKASKGELPEDDDEIARLVAAKSKKK